MQRINRPKGYKALHPIFDEFDRFYFATSESSLQSSDALLKASFDREFEALQGIFNKYGKQNYQFEFFDKHYRTLELEEYDDSNIIIAFSGGKDSVATVLKYLECGYNVYLYHLRGLKRSSYPDEWKNAQAIADYLDLPIVIEDIDLVGKLPFAEHPLKNIIIANGMIQWGIRNHIGTHIAFGNYFNNYLDSTAFYYAGDDCIDMYEAYEKIMRRYIPDFIVGIALDSINDTLESLSKDKKLLELCKSCLGAYRFRAYNHNLIEKKYGVTLMPDRCGTCWKCALEYIYMADHDVLEYNEEYYKHCIDVLKKANKHENEQNFTTIQALWKTYLFYDMSQSKWKGIVDYGRRKKVV